ncbi:MAG: plastocyanin/azurin family copper-binding protein [Thermaerobacter sp.]|nr:plastocyanin/azurin family copper-binding protein [Thermaerobacter sp.]
MASRPGVWAGIVKLGLGIGGLLFGPAIAGAGGLSKGAPPGYSGWALSMMSGFFSGGSGFGYGTMRDQGDGGMMGSYAGLGVRRAVSTASAIAMGDAMPQGASIDRARNRIVFQGRDVQLDVGGSPTGQKDETYRIAGLVNPTIVVPTGADVHVAFVNADTDMPHNFVLTPAGPPFTYVPMMQAPIAFPGASTPFLSPGSKHSLLGIDISFVARAPGNYTYLCTVPGHAERGMYGSFVVQKA